jgi:hypothetical protein
VIGKKWSECRERHVLLATVEDASFGCLIHERSQPRGLLSMSRPDFVALSRTKKGPIE